MSSRWRRSTLLWVALVLAAGVALAAGSGAFAGGGSKPLSLYDRTLAVAGEYRCPVCQGETAADSNSPEAIQIRDQIGTWLSEGRTQGQIRSSLVADYGPFILEKPPASGFGALLWFLPVGVVALAVAGLGLAFARWRRTATSLVPAPISGPPLLPLGPAAGPRREPDLPAVTGPAPAVTVLAPAVAVLARSAGAAVVVQGTLFDVDVDVDAPAPAPDRESRPVSRGRRRYQQVTLAGGVALMVLAGALWLVDRSSSARLPGDTISGGQSGITAEVDQAQALAASDPTGALTLFDEVLAHDADQPIALTGAGWLYAQAGYVTEGLKMLDKAEVIEPSYAPAHFYRGFVLLDYAGNPGPAATEMKWILSHDPATAQANQARQALAVAQGELRVSRSK
jgi:cytochrome c-type biogenesis protein CcmH